MKIEGLDAAAYFVDVILPLALPKAYTYQLTEEEANCLAPGFRIAVPFGKQKMYTAIVERVHQVAPQTYIPKPIGMILDDTPSVTERQLEFWSWMASYYMCYQGEVMRACLPAALLLESETLIVIQEVEKTVLDQLSDLQFLVYEALQKQALSLDDIAQITDRKRVMPLVVDMMQKGAVSIHQKIEEKFKPKKARFVRLNPDYEEEKQLQLLFEQLKRAPKQLEVIMKIFSLNHEKGSWNKVADLKSPTEANSGPIKALIDKGILEENYQEISRELYPLKESLSEKKQLSKAQNTAYLEIEKSLEEKPVVLFEGVTSSGKTEVYIDLIEKQLHQGKQVLYLVPEISLTPQVVDRLISRFGDQVLVYHSKFSIHERAEVWQTVLSSKSKGQIIVGARSAIFLPFQDLGLVIVDEEHENSYKQFDPAPRYQARDSVIYLAKLLEAKVLLGSATPSLESAENVRNGKYGWVLLSERFGGVSLPKIELINLKEAQKKKQMKGMFSDDLVEAMQQTLAEKKQVILFQNRRGYAPILECTSCGHSPQCTQCDVSLTYHQTHQQLRCHYCSYHIPMPQQCHACGMPTLTTKGVGTQQIEEHVKEVFPEVKVGRMDWDSTRGKWGFDKIINAFMKEEIQVLVGTQMVVKGLDFKNVLLVGVINADHVLNFPDFRAHERSYQMLCQVAGRAGRSDQKGRVLMQTYQPEHPTLKQVLQHDYEGLFAAQKKERLQYHYPPYFRMIRVTLKCRQYETINLAADWFANVLKQSYSGTVLGPVFPLVARVRNQYQKQILIKIDHEQSASSLKDILFKTFKSFQAIASFRSTRVNFDVDPY
ncbi:primosomal protein N' [Flavobacteriaceae bacterium]|nr:primosomal protein N' [Flavobacteriaceae bacterium]MDA9572104.1 primosomal protein N' [Flavobacteriaceae bacterium]